MSQFGHIPVLLDDHNRPLFDYLRPQGGERVLDATVGLGGHAKAFWNAVGSTGHTYCIDADIVNLQWAKECFPQDVQNVTFIHGNFRDIGRMGLPSMDIIFADLGVSSPHLDDPMRGFTFRDDAPLDLRFDHTKGTTAAVFLATSSEEELKRIFRDYGEMRGSGKLAHVLYRELHRGIGMQTTAQFRTVVERVYGYRAPSILPQAFQALRVAVNDELGALEELLDVAPALLKVGGRLGIISYHSLEDRMVKEAFRPLCTAEKDPLTGARVGEPAFVQCMKKPVIPSPEELERNPRSRSAKFRAMVKRA